MKTTLYQILGVEPTASLDDVRAAYARKRDAAEKSADSSDLALLRQALEVLSDPLQRNAYDASRSATAEPGRGQGGAPSGATSSSLSTSAWLAIVGSVAVIAGAGAWMLARHEPPKPVVPATVADASKIGSTATATTTATTSASAPTAASSAPSGTAAAGSGSASSAPAEAAPSATASSATASSPTTSSNSTSPTSASSTSAASPPASSTLASLPSPSALVQSAERDAPPVERSAESVFADVARSVARINVSDANGRAVALGSGVVIEPDVVLTNCHVAKAGPKLTVKLGGSTFPATILLADEEYDLCRLAVAALRALPVKIGKVAALRTGQKVFAIGAPAGLDLTISEGIVSSLRTIDEGTVIQTTAPISQGSSGGGLFDATGRLVVIITFQHRFGQNLNFALPADWIARMQERGPSGTGWRGATVAALTGDKSAGLLIGQWLCRDWISGRSGKFRFEPDGRVNIAMAGSPAVVLNYGMSGKALVVFDASNKGAAMTINELTPNKMILKGIDRSIACER